MSSRKESGMKPLSVNERFFLKELMIGHGGKIGSGLAVPGLVQPVLAEQSQEIGPLQPDRPGGPRTVAAVGCEHLDEELPLESADGFMIRLDGFAHARLLPRCPSIPGSRRRI